MHEVVQHNEVLNLLNVSVIKRSLQTALCACDVDVINTSSLVYRVKIYKRAFRQRDTRLHTAAVMVVYSRDLIPVDYHI